MTLFNPTIPTPSHSMPRTADRAPTQGMRTITLMIAIMTGLSSMGFMALNLTQPAWQLSVVALAHSITAIYCTIALLTLIAHGNLLTIMRGVAGTFGITLVLTAALISGLGIVVGMIALVFVLLISTTFTSDRIINSSIIYGLTMGAICSLLSNFSPVSQVQSRQIDLVLPAFLAVLAMSLVTLLTMKIITATLRLRLVIAFLVIVIVPLSLLSFIQTRFLVNSVREQTNQQMLMAARQTATAVDDLMNTLQDNVESTARFEVFGNYLSLLPRYRAYSAESLEIYQTFQTLFQRNSEVQGFYTSYALLDQNGVNVFDTYTERVKDTIDSGRELPLLAGEGTFEGGVEYFMVPFRTGKLYISPLTIQDRGKAFFYVSAPIRSVSTGETLGVLRARLDGLVLQELIAKHNALAGNESYAILVDENNVRLADGYTPANLYKAVAPPTGMHLEIMQNLQRIPNLPAPQISTNFYDFDRVLSGSVDNPFFTVDLHEEPGTDLPEVGAIAPVAKTPWKVAYLIDNYDEAPLAKTQNNLVLLLTIFLAGGVGMAAVWISQVISSPIAQLATAAQYIAKGDMNVRATESDDELGFLAKAFNQMTAQVRSLVEDLEARVQNRTQQIARQNEALQARTRQFETVSDVARQIVSTQDLETLLTSVTKVVSERFNFYHVGIFLVDANREFATLRAANSEGGQRMLARHHQLQVGKVGIVGYVTDKGLARIVTDVGADATFFNNSDLPLTRSEMALPLMVGEEIIGALDIQSVESSAFHDDDIELFNILADQVAVALYNNRLFTQTAEALAEAQQLHRQYLRQEWEHETDQHPHSGYVFSRTGVAVQTDELPIWQDALSAGKPYWEVIPGEGGQPDQALLAVPIVVRGEPIGVIHVQDSGENRYWSEDEMTVINDVAGQVAVALENARLFEATTRRAEREKRVSDITARIRSTNDPEQMMQIAVSELQRTLGAGRAQIYLRRSSEKSGVKTI